MLNALLGLGMVMAAGGALFAFIIFVFNTIEAWSDGATLREAILEQLTHFWKMLRRIW